MSARDRRDEYPDPTRLELQRSFERAGNRRLFIWAFSIVLVLTAGTAFVFKLYEFYYTATREGSAAMGSFLIPLCNYLVVAAGFFCMFLWAYSRGEFKDMEAAKYRMLEMQREIDDRERAAEA